MNSEPNDDLEKRLQKLIMQFMVDSSAFVTSSIIKSLVHVVIDGQMPYREDFFLPQVAMLIENTAERESKLLLCETILDFYDALLR